MSDDDHLKATTENPAMVRCEACNGAGVRTITGQGGRMIEQKCTFCDGLGVLTPLALARWHEYVRAGRLPK